MLPNFYRYVTGALTLQAALANPIAHPHHPYGAPALEANHLGAVASESEICSHIGIDLLKKGGNAADALVGTVFCVGVVGMYHSGMSEVLIDSL
jgi:gamma-glutamyltranspeptidase/glutathione hydrolase